jgi:hypothetical protein
MIQSKASFPLQIFASDIMAEGLKDARESIYPESIAADVLAGPAGPVLRQERRLLSSQQRHPGLGYSCRAQRARGSAVSKNVHHRFLCRRAQDCRLHGP